MKKRVLSTLLVLCLVLGLLPGVALAAATPTSGTCGENLSWNYNTDTRTLSISGYGDMDDYSSINDRPWSYYSRLAESISIGNAVSSIGKNAFNHCDKVMSIIIPSSVVNIGDFAFFDCKNIQEVTIPNSVLKVGKRAFAFCDSLSVANIASSVTDLGEELFYECPSLKSINVDLSNPQYSSVDGVLFDKNQSTLIAYPLMRPDTIYSIPDGVVTIEKGAFESSNNLKEVVIPASVRKIGGYAFGWCKNLATISIPQGITNISGLCFSGCSSLASIIIPDSVTLIDAGAFANCTGLSDIYFTGTAEQWAAVKGKESTANGGNAPLQSATIHYNYGGSGPTIPKAPDAPVIFLTTPTTIQEKTSTTVKWNAVPNADQYLINVMTKGAYLDKDTPISVCQQEFQFETPGEYEIWVQAENTAGKSAESNHIVVTVVEKAGEIEPDPEPELPSVMGIINNPEVFLDLEQPAGNKQCTLYANTIMLRRRAILEGRADWKNISIENTSKSLWTSTDMTGSYTYEGIYVEREGYGKIAAMSVEAKRNYFISLLNDRPEGIVIYYHGKGGPGSNSEGQHAILLTDYDTKTGTFYSIDPGTSHTAQGRVPLVSSSFPGKMDVSTQDDVLKNIHQIWYVKQALDLKALSSSKISSHCPVEMKVSINGSMLDSINVTGTISNEYASMTATGSGQNRSVEVSVAGSYDFGNGLDVELLGTDTGTMTFTVEHQYTDGSTDTQTFQNVPVTSSTSGTANINPQSTVILTLVDTKNPVEKEYWIANPGETVTAPSEEETVPSPSYPDIPWIPSTPSRPTTPTKPSTPSTTTPVTPPAETKPEDTAPETPPSTPAVTLPFTDVSPADWFYPSVQYVYEKGLMTGDGNTTIFNPNGSMTRAMVWTVLGRMAGADVSGSGNEWFAKAQAWAVAEGVSDGSNPNGGVARQELVTMLWRSLGSPAAAADLSGFSDGGAVASWAGTAMQWAAANGILTGDGGALKPAALASRAEVAAILMRFCVYSASAS